MVIPLYVVSVIFNSLTNYNIVYKKITKNKGHCHFL